MNQLLPRTVSIVNPYFFLHIIKAQSPFFAPSIDRSKTFLRTLIINMPTPNASSDNSNTTTQVSWSRRFWLFICLVSFLCALGIFTESQFYAYTIGIHGTYALIIYYFVGVILSSAIQVLLIQPSCLAFLEKYKQCFILKSCGDYLVMFTICFLSSGTGLPYLGLSSDGTAPSPAVAVAVAPYRSQAFSEIAGLLASALLTVNALSITILLRPAQHNTFFQVAAALTMESAIRLLYKYPHLTVVAAVFTLAMTLLKDFLCYDQVVKADDKAGGKPPADDKAAGKPPADGKAAGKHKAAGKPPADGKAAGKPPADGKPAGKQPADDKAAGKPPAVSDGKPAGKQPRKQPRADGKAAGKRPPANEMV